MKNCATSLFICLLISIMSLDLIAQTTLFFDDFSDENIDDWTLEAGDPNLWSISSSTAAGGTSPELNFSGFNSSVGLSRLVSPIINTTGYSTVYLSFPHVFYLYSSPGASISIETTNDGGTSWNTVWELNGDDLNDAYFAFEVITITDNVGDDNFQFALKYEDTVSSLIANWSIDDIRLSDMPVMSDVLPNNIYGLNNAFYDGDEVSISCSVTSYGMESSSFNTRLEIFDESDNILFSSTKPVENLDFGNEITVDFDPWTSTEGNFTAVVTTLLIDDLNTTNDQTSADFSVYNPNVYCLPSGACSDARIDGFEFAGISNLNSGCEMDGYSNFTDLQGIAEIGAYYPLSISSNNGQLMTTSIWIDFNQDFQFDSEELILNDAQIPTSSTLNDELQIPWSAQPVTTRMRVCSQFFYSTAENPCSLISNGECEDYTITLTGGALTVDASVISIDMYQAYEQGTLIPKATVSNFGIETASFPVTLTIDNIYSSTKNINNLELGEEIQIEFDTWEAAPDEYTMVVSTNLVGDLDLENDQISQIISIAESVPLKKILGEEGTGTWCGFCPRGAVYMDSMDMKYPESWIGIAVHNNDPMSVPEYDTNISPLIGFAYPGFTVNRSHKANHTNLEDFYHKTMDFIALADIAIENKAYNETTKELNFTLSSHFVSTVSDLRFGAILIENGVTGTGPNWAQVNYFSGGGYGPMGGYENLPDPVPAEDMIYDHVGRQIIGGFSGLEGSLPPTVNYGETHSFEFSTIIDNDSWEIENMEIVGVLINHATGEVINSTIDHLLSNTTDLNILPPASINIYPNPASINLYLKLPNIIKEYKVDIHSVNGQIISEQLLQQNENMIDISDLPNGLYFIKIIDGPNIYCEKFEILR